MRYLGGKSKISKRITECILAHTPNRGHLIEPFVGGGGMLATLGPHFKRATVNDKHPDVAMLWRALSEGWAPPTVISKAQYDELRISNEPSALRGFVGFGVSFGGKWFGGMARTDGRNYAAESARGLMRDMGRLKSVKLTALNGDYEQLTVTRDDVVYCDPPHANTTGYTDAFDSVKFWKWAEKISKVASIYVSEYRAPPKWRSLWACTRTRDMRGDLKSSSQVTEQLFTLPQ